MLESAGAAGLSRARGLHTWAREAGFKRGKMEVRGGTTVYATPEERRWWGIVHIDILRAEAVGGKMKSVGLVGEDGIEEMIRDFEKWKKDPGGWFAALKCEVLAKK